MILPEASQQSTEYPLGTAEELAWAGHSLLQAAELRSSGFE